MKKSILISGLGGSLFPYLYHKLKNKYSLYFVDSNKYLTKIYPDLNFFPTTLVTDDHYPDIIRDLISRYDINYYIPLIDEELKIAKEHIDSFNNVSIISPKLEFIELCLNKYKLMHILHRYQISSIPSYLGSDFNWEIELPLFIKPVSGRGSRGIQIINQTEQLNAYYILENRLRSDTLIQPKISGIEYTVGVTVNNLNDILSISCKRIFSKKGITQAAITENNQAIFDKMTTIVNTLNPCGPINVQLFLTEKNEVKIFEINPRFSTTSIMEYQGGLDLISLYIKYKDKNYTGKILAPKEGVEMYRRWDSVFYEK